jgi:hypothetical protein
VICQEAFETLLERCMFLSFGITRDIVTTLKTSHHMLYDTKQQVKHHIYVLDVVEAHVHWTGCHECKVVWAQHKCIVMADTHLASRKQTTSFKRTVGSDARALHTSG